MLPTTSTLVACYHCGQDCAEGAIAFQDKNFCCAGCKTVFDILQENDLCQYYTLADTPGASLKNSFHSEKYAYLNDEATISRLIDFKNDSLTKITFHIPQMHCSSCIWLLENLYKINPAITQCHVNFLKKQISITFLHSAVSLRKVVELLASIGYEPELTLADTTQRRNSSTSRKLIYQIGIAGFCFGNIMLLSLPEYLAENDFFETFQNFFAWLNVLLTLPVILYSAQDYFTSAWSGFKTKTLNINIPIAVGFTSLFIVSLFEIILFKRAGYNDSLTGLIFFLLIGKFYQQKTYQLLSFERDYKSYFPISVAVLRNKQEKSEPLENLQVRDRILVKHGDLIPADSVLIQGNGWIDYSFVTGESDPVFKRPGEMIFAGGKQQGEAIELEIIKAPAQSYLTQLWNNDAFTKKEEGDLSEVANKISKIFTIAILIIAASTVIYWQLVNPAMVIKAFTSVLIIACPCAFALSIPFTLGSVLRIFGRKKFYLKNAGVIEKLAQADVVIFDKTGTLTEHKQSKVEFIGVPLKEEEKILIKSLLKNSTHPLSQAIYSSMACVNAFPVSDFKELPGKGITAFIGDTYIQMGSDEFVGMNQLRTQIQTPGSRVYLKIDKRIKGYFLIAKNFRAGIKEMIQSLGLKYELYVLSGDNDGERNQLEGIFGESAVMLFNQSPQDKLDFVQKLEERGKKTIMAGDGLNDAGALKRSFVGIAVSEDSLKFTPSSDAIMEGNQVRYLHNFLRYAKKSITIIKASFIFSLIYNLIALAMAVQGIFTPVASAILMPISSVSLVLFSIISVKIFIRGKELPSGVKD